MGKPEQIEWQYDLLGMTVTFEKDHVRQILRKFPPGVPVSDPPLPIDVGMAQDEVERIVGTPSEVCNAYALGSKDYGVVCFSTGRAVVSKRINTVSPPPPAAAP
jgi:hypothetical protein